MRRLKIDPAMASLAGCSSLVASPLPTVGYAVFVRVGLEQRLFTHVLLVSTFLMRSRERQPNRCSCLTTNLTFRDFH